MQYSIVFSNTAKRRLKEIKNYIANNLEAPYSALKIVGRLKKGISILSVHPQAGAAAPESHLAGEGIRILHVHKYRVYYGVNEEKRQVQIYTILHHLQDSEKNLSVSSARSLDKS